MGKSCTQRHLIYSATGITGDTTSTPIAIPSDVDDFYIKTYAVEDVAGSATFTLYGNETNSTTDAYIVDDLGGAKTVTAIDRAFRAALSVTSKEVLPPWLYVTCTTVSGSWTITVELWYSTTRSN